MDHIALTKKQNLKSFPGYIFPDPVAMCHCRKEKEKEWGKRDFELQRELFSSET